MTTMQPLLALIPNVKYKDEVTAPQTGLNFNAQLVQCFLESILQEVMALQKEGFQIKCADNVTRYVHPYIIGCINDTKALPYGACNVQPPSLQHSCIHCDVPGMKKEGCVYYTGAMHFAGDSKSEKRAKKKLKQSLSRDEKKRICKPFATHKTDTSARASMKAVARVKKNARAKKDAIQKHGYKTETVLAKMRKEVFHLVHHQQVDLSHHLRTITQRLLLNITDGIKHGFSGTWMKWERERRNQKHALIHENSRARSQPWMAIDPNIGLAKGVISKMQLPSSTQVAALNLFGGKSLKIGDCITLLEHDVLAFVISLMTSLDDKVRTALVCLLLAMKSVTAKRIRTSDLSRLHTKMVVAVMKVETVLPFSFCTSALHVLLHVFQPTVGYVARLGLVRASWMLATERWNSEVSRLISSRKNICDNFLKKLSAKYFLHFTETAQQENFGQVRQRSWLNSSDVDIIGTVTEGVQITASGALSDYTSTSAVAEIGALMYKGTKFQPYNKRKGKYIADYAHTLTQPSRGEMRLTRILKLLRVTSTANTDSFYAEVQFGKENAEWERMNVDGISFSRSAQHALFCQQATLDPNRTIVRLSSLLPVNCSVLYSGEHEGKTIVAYSADKH